MQILQDPSRCFRAFSRGAGLKGVPKLLTEDGDLESRRLKSEYRNNDRTFLSLVIWPHTQIDAVTILYEGKTAAKIKTQISTKALVNFIQEHSPFGHI